MTQEKLIPPIIKGDVINLMALALAFWKGRKTIFISLGLFLFLGLFIAIFSREEYTTTVKLMPESNQSLSLGALSGLASQFGFGGLSALPDGEGIPPEYYPAIVGSLPFMKELMSYELTTLETDEKTSLFQYLSEYRRSSVLSTVKRYTIRLPLTIFDAIKGDKQKIMEKEGMRPIIHFTEEEWKVFAILVKNISVTIDNKVGIVTLEVKMPGDYLVAEVADRITEMLVEYVKDYKTEKTRNDLEFIEVQLNGAKKRFEKSQESLAKFRDQNHGQMTEMAQATVQRLQSDYDLSFKIYSAMAQKFEETHIMLQEQTPVVKVLEPAVVPEKKSAPRRSLIVIVSLVLGGLVGIGILYGKMYWKSFRTQFKMVSQEVE